MEFRKAEGQSKRRHSIPRLKFGIFFGQGKRDDASSLLQKMLRFLLESIKHWVSGPRPVTAKCLKTFKGDHRGCTGILGGGVLII